jgi:hypothetical protein
LLAIVICSGRVWREIERDRRSRLCMSSSFLSEQLEETERDGGSATRGGGRAYMQESISPCKSLSPARFVRNICLKGFDQKSEAFWAFSDPFLGVKQFSLVSRRTGLGGKGTENACCRARIGRTGRALRNKLCEIWQSLASPRAEARARPSARTELSEL